MMGGLPLASHISSNILSGAPPLGLYPVITPDGGQWSDLPRWRSWIPRLMNSPRVLRWPQGMLGGPEMVSGIRHSCRCGRSCGKIARGVCQQQGQRLGCAQIDGNEFFV